MTWSSANVAERRFEPPSIAVSTVIFALRDEGVLSLPLVRRIREPYKGLWALPGGPIAWDKSLEEVAADTLRDTTGLNPRYLEQLYAFGTLNRSPDRRIVSVVYWALVDSGAADEADESENVRWFAAEDLPGLAFDHNLIVDYALWRLRNKFPWAYAQIAQNFLGETFTLAQLREVYEVVLKTSVDPANFRRQLLGDKTIVPTGEFLSGVAHRPPRLYRFSAEIPPIDNGPLPQYGDGDEPPAALAAATSEPAEHAEADLSATAN